MSLFMLIVVYTYVAKLQEYIKYLCSKKLHLQTIKHWVEQLGFSKCIQATSCIHYLSTLLAAFAKIVHSFSSDTWW